MGYVERNTWSQLIGSVAALIAYLVVVLPQLATTDPSQIDWVWPMIWTIVAGIVVSIVLSILWGIFAGMVNRDVEYRADRRDREIEWLGDRVGQGLLVLGSLVALILAMVEADWFWIGNAIFLGFFASAFLGGLTRIIVYRRGMP
jgi:MFS family permease